MYEFDGGDFTWHSVNITEFNYTLKITFKEVLAISNSGKFPDRLAISIVNGTE
jgi:hypothetical protein